MNQTESMRFANKNVFEKKKNVFDDENRSIENRFKMRMAFEKHRIEFKANNSSKDQIHSQLLLLVTF